MKNEVVTREKHSSKGLRSKLLSVFIIYGLALLAMLWVMQFGLLEKYYESSMVNKCKESMKMLSTMYSQDETLTYEDFCSTLSELAAENDIYFFMEAVDDSFSLASSDLDGPGRFLKDGPNIIADAKAMLLSSASGEIDFVQPSVDGGKTIVFAATISSEYRSDIRLYASASLSPLGPAVSILRSQLLIITIAVIILGIIIAFITSKRLAAPMISMSQEAKKLGEGDFDTHFEGADYQEIDELANTLNSAAKQLKTSDNLRKDLLANVSHDLRTPLTMIKSYAEMIRDLSGDNKEKRETHLGVIIEETDRLADLVGGILELSKVQSGAEEFNIKKFALNKAAEDIFQTYKLLEEEGFEMIYEAPSEDFMVNGDEARIKQVIANLLSNAIKYSEEQKYVRLYFETSNSMVKLCVQDKGIGIPEADLDKIWSRYQRSSQRGARAKEGNGLGLSICSEVLKRHSAKYGVCSTLGEGSIFWFEMPMVK